MTDEEYATELAEQAGVSRTELVEQATANEYEDPLRALEEAVIKMVDHPEVCPACGEEYTTVLDPRLPVGHVCVQPWESCSYILADDTHVTFVHDWGH